MAMATDQHRVEGENTEYPLRSRFNDEYENIKKIGKGAYGIVYRANHKLDKQCYAIKVSDIEYDSVKQIKKEIIILSRLSHENIVKYYSSWTEDKPDKNMKQSYIQMEYCDGKTLDDLIQKGLHKNVNYVWLLFNEILQGLNYVHYEGIMHRDLNPSNIFITNDHVKIGDFGLSTVFSDNPSKQSLKLKLSVSTLSAEVGTEFYMAPEVAIFNYTYTTKVDIYSLGITFFEMCFPLKTPEERTKYITKLRKKKFKFPTHFDVTNFSEQVDLIKKMLNHDPNLRPCANELLRRPCIPSEPKEIAFDESLKYSIANKNSANNSKIFPALYNQQNTQEEIKIRIHEVKIVLDKDYFYSGGKVTGRLLVKTADPNWGKDGKLFVKFYDRLDLEWVEDVVVKVGVVKRNNSNFRKPFQVNVETFFDKEQAVLNSDEADSNDFRFVYPFEFTLPDRVQGTLDVKNAKCQYFIKAYLTTDESVAKHYQTGVNVFDKFFKSLNHTYAKQEVIVLNPPAILPAVFEKHLFEAKSQNLKVTVTLPKLIYSRNETIQIHCNIERADQLDTKHPVDLHKASFNFFQLIKLFAQEPYPKSRLFDILLAHTSRKNVHQNNQTGVILEEVLQIPSDIPNSSTRIVATNESYRPRLKPIEVNYKLSLEFWRNFYVNELDVNIPLLVDPEA